MTISASLSSAVSSDYLVSLRAVLAREGVQTCDGFGGAGSFGALAVKGDLRGSYVQLKPGMSAAVVRQVLAEVSP